MKILFLDQFSDLGGAQQCLLALLPAIKLRGWDAVVAAPGGGPLHALSAGQGATAVELDPGSYSSGYKSPLDFARFATRMPLLKSRIAEIIASTRPGVIYVNGPRMAPAAAWANRGKLPVIFHVHSLLKNYAASLTGRAMASQNVTVIGVSKSVLEPIRPYFPPDRVRLIYNGVSDCGGKTRPSSTGTFRVGLIGRIAPQKGQAEFIEAARLLTGHDIVFEIIGAPLFGSKVAETYEKTIRNAAGDLPVIFRGWQDDICSTLAKLDLVVIPSDEKEGATRVIPEAFSARVPVLATRSGSIAELIEDGTTGFLLDRADPQNLAARIAEIRALPETKINSITTKARLQYEAEFTIAQFQNNVLNLLATLVP